MTQTACQIIIRIGTLRHLWKSIKSLRRLSRDDTPTATSPPPHHHHHPDILEVWSLLGLHSLYVATGIESLCHYIPLYFYVKMVGLILFFCLPSASNRNIPAQFLFEKYLVKSVDQLHTFVDQNVGGVLTRQIRILPWRLADLVVPGVLGYSSCIGWDEFYWRRHQVFILREQEWMESRQKYPYYGSSVGATTRLVPKLPTELINVDGVGLTKGAKDTQSDDSHRSLSTNKSLPSQMEHQNKSLHTQTSVSNNNDDLSSQAPSSITSTPPKHKTRASSQTTPPTSTPHKSSVSSSSKIRNNTLSSPTNPLPPFPSTPPPPQETLKRSKSSFSSPIAQSRLSSSSVQLQIFSRQHHTKSKNRRRQTIMPTVRDTQKSRALAASNRGSSSLSSSSSSSSLPKSTSSWNSKRPSRTKSSNDSLSSSPSKRNDFWKHSSPTSISSSSSRIQRPKNHSKSSILTSAGTAAAANASTSFQDSDQDLFLPTSPLSTSTPTPPSNFLQTLLSPKLFGKSVRKVVTGNANIRVRDFLFDLDLPTSTHRFSSSSFASRYSENDNDNDNNDDNDAYDDYEELNDDGEGPLLSLSNHHHHDHHYRTTPPPKTSLTKRPPSKRRQSSGDVLHRRPIPPPLVSSYPRYPKGPSRMDRKTNMTQKKSYSRSSRSSPPKSKRGSQTMTALQKFEHKKRISTAPSTPLRRSKRIAASKGSHSEYREGSI